MLLIKKRPFKIYFKLHWPKLPSQRKAGSAIPIPAAIKLKRVSNERSMCSFSTSYAKMMIHFDNVNDKIKCDVLGKGFWQQKALKIEGRKDWI